MDFTELTDSYLSDIHLKGFLTVIITITFKMNFLEQLK